MLAAWPHVSRPGTKDLSHLKAPLLLDVNKRHRSQPGYKSGVGQACRLLNIQRINLGIESTNLCGCVSN